MRLPEDKIKEGILHPVQIVRDAALFHFSRSYRPDPTVLPVVIQAIETYDWDRAFVAPTAISGLELSDETLGWVLRELGEMLDEDAESFEDQQRSHALQWLVTGADPTLLTRHREEILTSETLESWAEELIKERIELLSADPEACWRELERIAEEHKDDWDLDEVGLDHANSLIEAAARGGAIFTDRVLAILGTKIENPEGNPQTWMEGFAIRLAGEMRLEAAAPLILEKLLEDEDAEWLYEEAEEALPKIGTDAVVEAIAGAYLRGGEFFRMACGTALDKMRSDRVLRTSLDLLGQEKDKTLKTCLADAVLSQFDDEGIEPMRQLILSGQTDPSFTDLRSDLVAVATLAGVDFPEKELWTAKVTEDREQQKKRIAQMIEGLQEEFLEGTEEDEEIGAWEEDSAEWSDAEEDYDRPEPIIADEKIGRNDPCPCGSGKKYKKCCLKKHVFEE